MANFLLIGRIIPIGSVSGLGCGPGLLFGSMALFATAMAANYSWNYIAHNWLDLDQCGSEEIIELQDPAKIVVDDCQTFSIKFSNPKPHPFAITHVSGLFDRNKSIEWGQSTTKNVYLVTGFELPHRRKGNNAEFIFNDGSDDVLYALFLNPVTLKEERLELYRLSIVDGGYRIKVTPIEDGHKRLRYRKFWIGIRY